MTAEVPVPDNYVECIGCGKRFVGGDLESRLLRWKTHLDTKSCDRDDLDAHLAGEIGNPEFRKAYANAMKASARKASP